MGYLEFTKRAPTSDLTWSPPTSPSTTMSGEQDSASTEFKQSFQFITNEDAQQSRKAVRKHVMREYRRRERWDKGSGKKIQEAKERGAIARAKTDSSAYSRSSSWQEWCPEDVSMSDDSPRITDRAAGNPWEVYLGGDRHRPSLDSGIETPPPSDTDRDELGKTPFLDRRSDGFLCNADPWAGVAQAQVDPFSTMVKMEGDPQTQALLHHCKPSPGPP